MSVEKVKVPNEKPLTVDESSNTENSRIQELDIGARDTISPTPVDAYSLFARGLIDAKTAEADNITYLLTQANFNGDKGEKTQ